MKIAIPVTDGRLSSHFGHCEHFAIIDADPQTQKLGDIQQLSPPAHVPGALPKWLAEFGVNLVIAGGMGTRAQRLFVQNNIDVVVGAPDNPPMELARRYLTGRLQRGQNVCDH